MNQIKPLRVVVIGARGFIGAALRRRLIAEGIAALTPGSDELNLADPAAAARFAAMTQPEDAVVMLAALTPDKGRDIATLMKNLAMMQNVCAALEKTGCAQFVYVSSDAVYPFTEGRVSEDTPASPADLYGVTHLAREAMARSLAKFPVLVVRPTLVYGAADTHNAYGPNRFRRQARKDGRITLFGGGEERRDHIHVDDVVALIVRCLRQRSSGTLNAATGVSISFREAAELVARQFAEKVAILPSPRQNPVTHRHFDVTNLIKAFPDFRFTPIEEGLARVHKEMMSGE